MTREEEKKYDTVVEYSVATKEELDLVKCIVPGSWTDIIDDIIYARTGYDSFEQWAEEEGPYSAD